MLSMGTNTCCNFLYLPLQKHTFFFYYARHFYCIYLPRDYLNSYIFL